MTTKKTGNYQIPFDNDGNQVDYYGYGIHLEDNYIFHDTLIYKSYYRGRSSIGFQFERKSNGKLVTMFVSDLNIIMHRLLVGQITADWTFTKKGQNYGCCVFYKENN